MKEPQRITFDGTGITVFELKREIINVSGLGDGSDFDLYIYDESTNEEYDDDTTIIPRSSSVVARRVPAARPGHGKAARYVSGKAPVSAKNASRVEQAKAATQNKNGPIPTSAVDMNTQTEEERIAAMFAAEGSQWEQHQQQMAHVKPVYHKGSAVKKHVNHDKPIPLGYVCHRCGEKGMYTLVIRQQFELHTNIKAGHWIQDCPTNDDPNFEPKARLKRTTGIPRSFMRVVKPTGSADDLADDIQSGKIMLDADGNQVIVEPDKASWEKFEAKHKAAVAQQEAAASSTVNKELEERGLLCPIDKRLFADPVKTPCCGKNYCHECIENTLLDSDLVCPNCGENVLIDDLVTDQDMVEKIREYEREKAAAKSPQSPKSPKEVQNDVKEPEQSGVSDHQLPEVDSNEVSKDEPVKSPSPSKSAVATPETTKSEMSTTSKKRPADEDDTDWANVPKGPAAMRNQQQQQPFPTAPQFANAQFPMMPNFPVPGPFPMQQQFPPFNNNFFPAGNMNMMGNMGWQMNPQMVPNMGSMGPTRPTSYSGQQFNNQTMQQPNRFQNQQNNNHDDSAYMRQPVNPRHQHRQKRARPCDYTTLS